MMTLFLGREDREREREKRVNFLDSEDCTKTVATQPRQLYTTPTILSKKIKKKGEKERRCGRRRGGKGEGCGGKRFGWDEPVKPLCMLSQPKKGWRWGETLNIERFRKVRALCIFCLCIVLWGVFCFFCLKRDLKEGDEGEGGLGLRGKSSKNRF